MGVITNVTLLLPKRKIYCDFAFNIEKSKVSPDPENMEGSWEEITWKVTPDRPGYSRLNPFPVTKGDVYLQRYTYAFMRNNIPGEGGAQVFMFEFGYIAKTRAAPPGTTVDPAGYAVIAVDIRQNAFPAMGKEAWAKKTYLIPQMENIFGIFWG
jgi:hypothetical protein